MFFVWSDGDTCTDKTIITLFDLTTISSLWGEDTIFHVRKLYINAINKWKSFLTGYEFSIRVRDTNGDDTTALEHTVNIVKDFQDHLILELNAIGLTNCTNKTVLLPIAFGCSFSSQSIITAPVFGIFDFLQMSAASASITLSNKDDFPNFFRVVPTSSLPAAGVINLCKMFNWTKIEIVYYNNNYGKQYAESMTKIAKKNDIEAHGIRFEATNTSYYQVASEIKQSGNFIIVLISYTEMVYDLMTTLHKNGISTYPYYFIGTTGWFDPMEVETTQQNHLTLSLKGMIGITPFQANLIDIEKLEIAFEKLDEDDEISFQYTQLIDTIVKAKEKANIIDDLWYNDTESNPNSNSNISNPSVWSYYGWDSIDTIIGNVLPKYQEMYGSIEYIWDGTTYSQSQVMDQMKDILVNHTSFIGATGNITFDENFDRENGLFLVGNVIDDNGTMNIIRIGFIDPETDELIMIKIDEPVWPHLFNENNMKQPVSSKRIIKRAKVLKKESVEVVSINAWLSAVFCAASMAIYTYGIKLYRKKSVDRRIAIHLQLDIVICIAVAIWDFSIILFGIDEGYTKNEHLLISISNIRICLCMISFTIVFLASGWKALQVFWVFYNYNYKKLNINGKYHYDYNSKNNNNELYSICANKKLRCLFTINIIIDLIIFCMFGLCTEYKLLNPDDANSHIEEIDSLTIVQYVHAECVSWSNSNDVLIWIVCTWKMVQVLAVWFACCLLVNRIGFQDLRQFFGEAYATPFIISTIMAVSLIVFVVDLINRGKKSASRKDHIDFNYVLFSLYGLLIMNLALIANVGVRVTRFSMLLCQRVRCWKKNAQGGMIMDPYKAIKDGSPQKHTNNTSHKPNIGVVSIVINDKSATASNVPNDEINDGNHDHMDGQDNDSLLVHGSDNKENDNNDKDDDDNKDDEKGNSINTDTVSITDDSSIDTSNNQKLVRRLPHIAGSESLYPPISQNDVIDESSPLQ